MSETDIYTQIATEQVCPNTLEATTVYEINMVKHLADFLAYAAPRLFPKFAEAQERIEKLERENAELKAQINPSKWDDYKKQFATVFTAIKEIEDEKLTGG